VNTSHVPTEEQGGEQPIRYVLFVCNHNAGRSQMAQAFFERYGPEDVYAESAGNEPAAEIWPTVIEAMGEIGFDLSGRTPKKLTVEMQLHADWAITMGCGDSCPYVPATVEDWDIPDPAGRPLAEVRAIRDGIQARVRELIATRLGDIRDSRTAHDQRLGMLVTMLDGEFGNVKPAEEIRACAEAVLDSFKDARVRSHVLALAYRQARECLRRETCDLIATGETT
jgi:protein-tyrosine-phosphatase